MTRKREILFEKVMKRLITFQGAGKKALALLLSAALVITTLPVIQMPVSAEETADAAVQDSGYVEGKDGFHVVAYDKSARIEIPFVSGAKNYKVYLSQTEGLTDFSGASCVLSSNTYQSYTYAVDGDKDAANDSKTISIGYSDSEDNTYDFYLVTNDGSADTVQDSVEVKTRSTADATWTTPGHYDTGWYGDGSASEFTIKTAAQLAGLAVLTDGLNDEKATDFTGKTIHLASSVDLSAYLWTPIGTYDNPFCGSFDGGNYKDGKYTVQNVVTGLHTNDSKPSYQGLVGDAGDGSIIQNVGVVGGNINGCKYVGGVVGYASKGTLSNSYQTGTVSSSGSYSYSGGVIGYAADDTVTNCYNTGSVRGDGVGGIGGYIGGSTVTNCYNTGAVSSTGERIGGVVSDATNSTMTNCYNTGAVSGSGRYVGGIVSMISSGSSLTNCYNTGAVSGSSKYVGGIVSMIYFGSSLTNCYNTGAVSGTGDNVGGVAGSASGQTTNCYNTGAVSGKGNNVGGVAGSASGQTTNCYNTGAVSGTGDNVGGVAGSSSRTIKNAYSIGQVNGVLGGQYYNSTGTLDSLVSSKDDLINKVISDDGSDFIASPTNYAKYPLYDHKENGLFKDTNPVNQGYPVLRSFGYTDSTDAKGFSPATITVEDGKVTVDSDYGDGTESKPYIIRNAYQMDLVRSYTQTKDVYFKLAGNVDISPAQYNKTPDENGSWTSSDSWKTIGDRFDPFKGNLDGNHCTVSGMFISSNGSSSQYQGLFAYTEGGTIQNLGTAGSCITANNDLDTYFGSIAGIGSGTIRNCYNAGTVSSYGSTSTCELGGIVGQANYYDDSERTFISTTFENCYNSGTVIGNSGEDIKLGGVVGYTRHDGTGIEYQSTISYCYNSGTVAGYNPNGGSSAVTGGVAGLWYGSLTNSYNVGKVSSTGYRGGVAGRAIAASDTNNIVSNCYNLGTVSNDGTAVDKGLSGGVFGSCEGYSYSRPVLTVQVSNCYNTGTVYSHGGAGGVSGGIYYADVQNCYNTGKVTGFFNIGGFAGSVSNTSLQSCYNTGAVSGNPKPEDYSSHSDADGRTGGIVGTVASGSLKNCYNTGAVSSDFDRVGGIAGAVGQTGLPATVTNCYNTGDITVSNGDTAVNTDAQNVGGISGYVSSGSTLSLCYNLGTISGGYWAIGGIAGNSSGKTAVSKCYYSGYRTGIGFGGFGLGDGAATPFVSCTSSLAVGKTADISEVAYDKLDSDFKDAFGITDVQYPDGYESSDTDVLTVKDKTVTAVKAGNAAVNGTAGEHSNAKIVISQNALNMTDASGFQGAGTEKVSNVVGLPVSVVVLPKFTAFSVKAGDGKNYTGKIDNSKNTVWVKVPDGTDVSSLVATFTVNTEDVSVYADGKEQKSGSTQIDFSEDKTYSISGKSGYRDYTVMVVPESESLAGIDDYSIEIGDSDYAGTIDEDKKTISVTVPYGTDLTKLVADFSASNGSDVTVGEAAQESGTTENDFSSPVSYKVTGLDKSTETYTVKVTCADKSEKSLTHFELSDGNDTYQGKIDQKDHTITVTVSEDSDVSSLIAAFDTLAPNVKVGDKEQKSGTTANDFTNTVTYTVTAADGSTQDYKVTVTVEGESSCGFKSFSLTDKDDNTYTGTIDKEKHTIAVTVPSGTDVTELTAKFEATTDATVTVKKSKQESGTTKNNFTDPVTYTVKAKDGTTQDYKVTVTVKEKSCAFKSYSLEDEDGNTYNGTIDEDKHTIAVTVLHGTDVTKLTADFATVSDTTVLVGDDEQESGKTENDFTKPVTYTVKAEDDSSQNYTVTVKEAKETVILAYSLTDSDDNTYAGTINEDKHTIAVTVPFGTDVTELTADFTAATTATVMVGEDTQESGTTQNDFTNPVTYTVKASDDSTRDYKVTVTVADANRILSYSLTDQEGNTYKGTINKDKHTITVTVPKGTNVKKLTAEFTTAFTATVTVGDDLQVSGETVNNFTRPVTYTVRTAEDSSQKYKVTVTILSDNKDDDDKKSSHHHDSHSTAKETKTPKTETRVDSGKNTATVTTVASNVTQNGTSAEIQVTVPSVTTDTSNTGTALDLSKDAAVTVELPKDTLIQQLNAGKSVDVDMTLPSDAEKGTTSTLSVSINAAKEILEAAKASGQDITLTVRYAGSQQTAYSWTFQGTDLTKSSAPISDVDMQLKVSQTANVSEINSITQKNKGLVVQFSQDGALPATATIKFSAQDQGLEANQSMDLYQYDSASGQLIPTGKKVTVDAFGNTDLSVDNCHEYVLLPDSVRTITLDTRLYTMNIGSSYETGITLLNAPAGSRLKTYSSTDGVIATTVLPNGNVKAVGLKPGLTYAMIDVYDSKNRFLTHASVRIIIKGTDHPYGNSSRQFGIY